MFLFLHTGTFAALNLLWTTVRCTDPHFTSYLFTGNCDTILIPVPRRGIRILSQTATIVEADAVIATC